MQSVIHVGDCVDELFALDDASVHAVVTDPPYGLGDTSPAKVAACLRAWLDGERHEAGGGGFMGREWDAWVPGPEVFREVFRVLKPGGHALVFAGSRTSDLMGIALRLAGFEIRDTAPMLEWIYGSGFPKSLDVSKAIDAAGGSSPADQAATLRARREASGMTRADVAEAVGCSEASVRDWEEGRSRAVGGPVEFVVPSADYRAVLADLLGYSSDERRAAGVSIDRRGDGTTLGLGHCGELKTGGHTDAAREWSGWGTALKPAHEPIIVARKPPDGTVAANVLAHGTGAMNIDGCRVGVDPGDPVMSAQWRCNGGRSVYGSFAADETGEARSMAPPDAGRWPPNVLLVHAPGCEGDASGRCVEGCPVGEMARQSGEGGGGKRVVGGAPRSQSQHIGQISGQPRAAAVVNIGDSGTAARFFPTFRYVTKPSRAEREAGLFDLPEQTVAEITGREPDTVGLKSPASGVGSLPRANVHPTVKPVEVMRWLVRLVTPPGGVVLDPFAGSGTTGIAAALEGVNFIGIEREPEFAEIARTRIAWWSEHGEAAIAADKARRDALAAEAATGQTSIFDLLGGGE